VTHEYVIALSGHIRSTSSEAEATAVGWAAEAILAVGTDEAVRSISRGDSTFLDLDGCLVTPRDPDDPAASLEPGAPADLAFWRDGELVATVEAGHFTEGDAHRGPFPPPAARERSSG